jgi:hypothetical protein
MGAVTGAVEWSGRVDDVVEVHLSGRRVDARSGASFYDFSAYWE